MEKFTKPRYFVKIKFIIDVIECYVPLYFVPVCVYVK